MKPEVKKLWLEALRSGAYKQGFGGLRIAEKDTYCCLGVLCDVLGVDWGPSDEQPLHYACELSDSEGTQFLDSARITIGLSDDRQRQLIAMNDGEGEMRSKSFLEIADFIEFEVPVEGDAPVRGDSLANQAK